MLRCLQDSVVPQHFQSITSWLLYHTPPPPQQLSTPPPSVFYPSTPPDLFFGLYLANERLSCSEPDVGLQSISVSCCTLSLMGSFICKGLELISIIPSLIQLSLQIKVNQMLQSEITVPCQLLTSPGALRSRQTLMPRIYLLFPRRNLNFCTCQCIPEFRGEKKNKKYISVWFWYLYTCFVLSHLAFWEFLPRQAGGLIRPSAGIIKKDLYAEFQILFSFFIFYFCC